MSFICCATIRTTLIASSLLLGISVGALSPAFAQPRLESENSCWKALSNTLRTPVREMTFVGWLSLGVDALTGSSDLQNRTVVNAYESSRIRADYTSVGGDATWLAIVAPSDDDAPWAAIPVRRGVRDGDCLTADVRYVAVAPGDDLPSEDVFGIEPRRFILEEYASR